jgi:pyrimidine operon attenuation protein / uracil phosphoribosyltransferase
MEIKAELMSEADIARTVERMARQMLEQMEAHQPIAIVGLQPRGIHLAKRMALRIAESSAHIVHFGILDTAMYRDDVRIRQPQVRKTDIRFDVNDCNIFLVDDVLFTGRSIRAAIDALLDIGRPASVKLCVLVDRGLRELPLQPDIVGRHIPTAPNQGVRVRLMENDDTEGVWLVEK